MVNVSDLSSVLGNIGIKLTEKELEGLTENLPVNGRHRIYNIFYLAALNYKGFYLNIC